MRYTPTNAVDYGYATLAARLANVMCEPHLADYAKPHTRPDRRQFGRTGEIVLTNNTTASYGPDARVVIRLHHNQIATLTAEGVTLCLDHGWRSATTRERLSAILACNTHGIGLGTRNGAKGNRDWDAYLWSRTPEAAAWLLLQDDAVQSGRPGTTESDYVECPVMHTSPFRAFIPSDLSSPSGATRLVSEVVS